MPARSLQLGFKASQWGVTWPVLLATWELADANPEIDSGWLFDHFSGVRNRSATDDGALEAMATAAALAARTRRLRLGHIVLGNTHRHPALVAASAAVIDHVAGAGRFVLGLGTGWLEDDHHRFGWPLPPMGERMAMLEASVRIIKGMWQEPDGITLRSGPYDVRGARTNPRPATPGGPPIWLGTQGPRGLGIIARHADGWNANAPPETFRARHDELLRICDDVGRDPSEIEVSAQVMCIDRPTDAVLDDAATLIDNGATHIVFVIRASDGPGALAHLARDVLSPLRDRYG
jgi:alkanesulfonate monooxygenase SsuD/methylene tetrahydromethanopterin reductase-like flavin-dependent oxidoreductase (luciferase family)